MHARSAFLTALLICVSFARAAAPAPPLKAGFVERDITPEIGMEQPGGYGKAFHRTLHDPCKVRVALFDDGKSKVVLIGLDALVVPRQVVVNARDEIEKLCGIPGRAVMIGASHSHSSGPVGMILPGQFDGASEEVRKLAYEESSMANADYLARVTREIVEGVRLADAARVPAQLGFGYGHEDKVAFNRRQRMKNGQTWSHAGAMNPDIVEYAGPIDPQVGVIGAWDAKGKLLGTVVNFSCHATTNPGGISANWIYYLERTIQGALDSQAPVVFLQGACGDVTQVDNLNPLARPAPEAWAQFVGGRVGRLNWVIASILRTRAAGTRRCLVASEDRSHKACRRKRPNSAPRTVRSPLAREARRPHERRAHPRKKAQGTPRF